MERIKELNSFTKTNLGLGLLLLIYGFISRIIPFNVFWESKSVGWVLILLGLISVLLDGIKKRKALNKKTIWNKIGIGFICFTLLIQTILIIIIPNTDAFKVSKEFILNDKELASEVGTIKGFGLIPTGGISVQTNSNGKTGNANINLIIKGEKAYKSVTVFVFKDYEKDWEVYGIE
ncbi:conserved membrane protein of unknown function [Tenacibaculum sp. 190130A14a]|uniref:Cytochrome oxidase complex assembly protein 1 n=1 Tax=Tenacibaculum polynesiense TaxID=3137857 RepID=A0ABP1F1H7_9FLAO